MALDALLRALGPPIEDPEEETFLLFAQDMPSQNLGFVDARAPVLELSVAGRDLVVHQSPAVLSSDRAGGTTGAVVWKITPLFAAWLAAPDNILFRTGVLHAGAAVLELGCGISGIVGLTLAGAGSGSSGSGNTVSRYVLTDQPYVSRLLERNLAENRGSFDAVLACDCVYNEALVEPLVQACADACRLRADDSATSSSSSSSAPLRGDEGEREKERQPCVCVVAQQQRDPDVFETWMRAFRARFEVWRVPDALLASPLRAGSGFVVHVGVLRDVPSSR